MKRMQVVRIATGFSIVVSAFVSTVHAEDIRPLMQRELPNADGKSFTAVEVDFKPRSKADPHRHGQAFVFAYVLAGAVRSQLDGKQVRTYRAGDSWFEPPGARHTLTENISRSKRARLLVVFVNNTGEPLKTPDNEKESSAMYGTKDVATSPMAIAPAPQQMVDALYKAFGDNHSRAVHAKGVMAVGTFEPSSQAKSISRASIFANNALPVLVRFSDFTGIPQIPDTVGDANPRGFALKFQLPDGSTADVISHSFNGFPTATAGEFRELLIAIGSSGAGIATPKPLDLFLASHPVAKTFLTTQKPAPESYTTLSYFGVNTFSFVDARDHQNFVRYRFVPVRGESVLSPEQLAKMGPDYLQTELPARLARAPVSFTWYAQVAEAPDVIEDPSIAWPENRKLVELGVVRLDRMAPDAAATDKATMFSPLNVPEGITAADPMLAIRQGAYPLSFQHRQ